MTETTVKTRALYLDDPDWRLRAYQCLRELGIAVFALRFADWTELAPDIEAPDANVQESKPMREYILKLQERAWKIAAGIRKEAGAENATRYWKSEELVKAFDLLGTISIEAGQIRIRESQI